MLRKFNLSVMAALILWACCIVFWSLTDNPVFFPFETFEWDESPYPRLQAFRVSVFVVFAYLLALHFIAPNRRFRAIQALQIYLNIFTIVSVTVITINPKASESDHASFFGLLGITLIINFAARPTIRKYFNRR
jgi:hypothetical protein